MPLIKYEKKPNPQNPLSPDLMYFIHAAVPLSKESAHRLRDTSQARPPQKGQRGQIEVLAFAFDAISAVSKVRLKIPQELKTFEAKQSVGAALEVNTIHAELQSIRLVIFRKYLSDLRIICLNLIPLKT